MKPKTKKKAPKVPKALRSSTYKKYQTKDRRRRVLAVRLTNEGGHSVVVIGWKSKPTIVRQFPIVPSEVPLPVLMSTSRELAAWCARYWARHQSLPSDKSERGRRKRFLRKHLAAFNVHLETKKVVVALKMPPKPFTKPDPLKMRLPWICLYDPKLVLGDNTFHMHTAYCAQMDKHRKKIVNRKRGGASWVIEATTAEEAMKLQLAEFKSEDKGYDLGDFVVHECAAKTLEKKVLGKTVLGRVGRSRR